MSPFCRCCGSAGNFSKHWMHIKGDKALYPAMLSRFSISSCNYTSNCFSFTSFGTINGLKAEVCSAHWWVYLQSRVQTQVLGRDDFFFFKYPFSRAFKSLLRDYTYHYLHVLQLTGSFISALTGAASKRRWKPCIHKSKPPSAQEPCHSITSLHNAIFL